MLDFSYRLLQLRHYIATVEAFISSNIARFPLSAEQWEQLLESPELELEFDVSYEEFIETVEVFPEILRRSTFLISFILLETSLHEICDNLQRKYSNPISVYDLRGGGIQRAAKYVRLLHGVNIKDTPLWQDLCRIQELRNCIVHYSGRLNAGLLDQPIGRYIQSHSLLDLQPADPDESPPSTWVLSIRPGFCENIADLIKDFLDSLPEELRTS